MIKFNLICDQDHEFEIWFGSNDDFEKQKKRNLLACPTCGSQNVEKSLMAPQVSTARKKDEMVQVAKMQSAQAELVSKMREFKEHIVNNSEDVGSKFPEEARKIHYGEAEARGIRGEANLKEAEELVKEGIDVLPVPTLPDEKN